MHHLLKVKLWSYLTLVEHWKVRPVGLNLAHCVWILLVWVVRIPVASLARKLVVRAEVTAANQHN